MKKDRHVHVVREKKWNMAVRSAKTEVVENGKKVSAATVKKDSVKMLTAKKHSADAKQATEKNLLVNAVKNSNIRKIRSHVLRVLLQTTDARKRLLPHATCTDAAARRKVTHKIKNGQNMKRIFFLFFLCCMTTLATFAQKKKA